MASEPSTAEEVSETPDEIRELKLGILREWLKVVYIVSTFISLNIILGLLFATVVVLETAVTNVPNLALQPLAIHATSSEGVPVTRLMKSFVVLDVIRNLLKLYWKGQPNIQLKPDIPEANND